MHDKYICLTFILSITTKHKKMSNVAQTILEQIGGRRFIVMTGSKNFVANGNTLSMKLTRNASKANYLRITLTGNDDYNMEFISARGSSITTKAEFNGVYADQLQSIFTQATGLYTRL